MQIKEHDLTKGDLPVGILKYSAPFLLMNIVQTMLVLTDLFIVGRFTEGAAQVAAVTVSSSVIMLHLFMIFGITTSVTILIGRAFGSKDTKRMTSIVGSAMSLLLIIGIFITAEISLTAPYLLDLLATPTESEHYAIVYSRIFSLSFIPTCGLLLISAVLRGVGNSSTPFMFVCVGVLINFFLALFFVVRLELGSAGAATATVISQVLALIYAICYIRKKKFTFRFELKDFRFNKESIKDILYIGLPLSMQDTFMEASFLVLVYLANTLGLAAAAAYGILSRFWSLTLLPAYSFALALSAIVAQNMGAKKVKRAKDALRLCITYSATLTWFIAIILLIRPDWLMKTFTTDAEVIKEGISALKTVTWELFLVPFSFCLSSFFNACGKTIFTMIINCTGSFLIRTTLAFILVTYMGGGLFELGCPFIVSQVFIVISFLIYMKSGRWTKSPFNKKSSKNNLP